jgi:hypothetical protein
MEFTVGLVKEENTREACCCPHEPFQPQTILGTTTGCIKLMSLLAPRGVWLVEVKGGRVELPRRIHAKGDYLKR